MVCVCARGLKRLWLACGNVCLASEDIPGTTTPHSYVNSVGILDGCNYMVCY